MTTSKGLVEDSQDKLWSLGEYFNYKLYNDTNNQWTTLPIVGWGSKIIKDPTLPGTIWVSTDNEIKRTDGINILTLTNETIPNATGIFTGIAVDVNGILWTATWFPNQITGSSLIKYNSNTKLFDIAVESKGHLKQGGVYPGAAPVMNGKDCYFQPLPVTSYRVC